MTWRPFLILAAILLFAPYRSPWSLVPGPWCAPGTRHQAPGTNPRRGPYLGEAPPGDTPIVFGRDIVSTFRCEHGALAISPDARELAWAVFDRPALREWILFSRQDRDGAWTTPASPTFTDGRYRDGDPSFSRDGKSLHFLSNRPADFGPARGPDGMWLWSAEKDASGWTGPRRMRGPLETLVALAPPTFARDGSFYTVADTGRGGLDIQHVRRNVLGYLPPTRLEAPMNSAQMEEGVFISSDDTLLLFASNRPGGSGGLDLYVGFRSADGGWTAPVNLGPRINSAVHDRSPSLSPDGRYLFFLRGQGENYDYYWVDARILSGLRQNGRS